MYNSNEYHILNPRSRLLAKVSSLFTFSIIEWYFDP